MITKNVKLYLGDGFPVRIPVSQFDTMWQFVFEIIHNSQPWQIPTGATAVLNGKKPDGNVFAFAGTIADNKVTVDADVQMTAVAGQTVCELSILSDGKVVGTANFVLDVEAAPKSPDDVSSKSTLPVYEEMLNQLADTATVLLPDRIKTAILNCFQNVMWNGTSGEELYNQLYDALMNKEVLSIAAVFTQGSAVIYDTDSLDTLRQYLVVTASYDDGTTGEVSAYTLRGTLAAGTSTITASYAEKSATFDVAVTHDVLGDVVANGVTYRQLFEGEYTIYKYTFDDGTIGNANVVNGTPVVSSEESGSHQYSLKVYGGSSNNVKTPTFTALNGHRYYYCCRINCSRRSAGYIGVQISSGGTSNCATQETTDGWRTASMLKWPSSNTTTYLFIGSYSSANLDGFVDDVYCIDITDATANLDWSNASDREVFRQTMNSALLTYVDTINERSE